MIRSEDLYRATNDGLDIILDICPQARDSVTQVNKKFKIRNENTPSCTLRKIGDVWRVTDFGDDGHAMSPIDLYMKERGVERFPEAIAQLAARWGLRDELNRSVNKPERSDRKANADELDGNKYFHFKERFTETELQILGPKVTQETVDSLGWHSVESIVRVADRHAYVRKSTPTYPIFARECVVAEADGDKEEVKFYKIYEPLCPDKAWRFSYWPSGIKPRKYVNGLREVKKAYRQYNKQEEEAFNRTADEGQVYKPKKLPQAFICSGERDSLCCRSMGYWPLWFNSETYQLAEDEYAEIRKYVDTLYNIPDKDETGVRKGTELALRFIDIHTVWLPDWLSQYHDNRGKPRKDLRDWMELRQRRDDFDKLITLAMPARFWLEVWDEKKKKSQLSIDTACLYHFLRLNGFYILRDKNIKDPQYIRIQGNVVKRVLPRDMREFVRTWIMERAEQRSVLNLVLNTMKLSAAGLESLQPIGIDFTSCTPDRQLFYFPKATVEVTPDGIEEHRGGEAVLGTYVWEDNISPHRYAHCPDMFTITRQLDDEGKPQFDIKINSHTSKFLCYLINSSRLYWRKEMEQRFGDDTDAMRAYAAGHQFAIDGDGLDPDEIGEQKMCLINKIFTAGYMLHRHKQMSRAWAPMAMDNKIGEIGECNGRSGKSFFFTTLAQFLTTVKLSGRNPKLMDNPHVLDQVTKHTEMLFVDDCDPNLSMGAFYDNITSSMTVNPKNNQSYTIPFPDSPKLAFTTNYVPRDFDPSSEARLIYMVFSDYYHQKTETNDYLQTRTIRDDFGKDLYGEQYNEEEWNADINCLLQCCRFYLSTIKDGVKIQPPMENIIYRKHKADMGDNFEDWANQYFAVDGDHLNKKLVRKNVLNDYKDFSGVHVITMRAFTKKLVAFVITCPWIAALNPRILCNSGNRIIERPANAAPGTGVEEMIYVQSVGHDPDDDAPPF